MQQTQPTPVTDETMQKIERQMEELTPTLRALSPDLVDSTKALLTMLHSMKGIAPTALFHLILEVTPAQPTCTTTAGELEVLFSPTIDAESSHYRQLMLRAAGFFGIVSSVARVARDQSHRLARVQPDRTNPPPPPTLQSEQTPLQPPRSLLASSPSTGMVDLRIFRVAAIPNWYPGSPNSEDRSHVIRVHPMTFHKFKDLSKKVTAWMYNFFFTQANFAASNRFRNGNGRLVYTQFTPPWYKGDFEAGSGQFFHENVTTILMKRHMRSAGGYTRMQLTLSAFYDLEPNFSKEPLDYILTNADYLMQRFPYAQSAITRKRRAAQQRHSNRVNSEGDQDRNASTTRQAPPQALPVNETDHDDEMDGVLAASGFESGEPETAAEAAGLA